MKKTALIGIVVGLMIWVLWACGPDEVDEVIIPTFSHLVVETRSPEVDGEIEPFVVNKNEVITVEVHFSNPSNLALNSVSINGTRYFSNRFEEGTTNQRIVLHLNVGQITGAQSFFVDRFAYRVSPEEPSREVNIDASNRYDIFVLKSLPTASMSATRVFTNRIEVDVNIIDADQVTVANSILARLISDNTVVETKVLNRGINAIRFENLLSHKDYQFEIVTNYDLENGEGVVEEFVLVPEMTIRTASVAAPTASLNILTVSEDTIHFDINLNDELNTIIDQGLRLKLYLGETLIETKVVDLSTLTDQSFTQLLNNNTYTLRIIADYDLGDTVGVREDRLLFELNVKTEMRRLPDINVSVVSLTENEMIVRIDAALLDEAIALHNLYVSIYDSQLNRIARGALIQDAIVLRVDNLLANQALTLVVEGDIDLDDGQGVQRLEIFRDSYQTIALMMPSGEINSMSLGYDTVAFSISFQNPSNTALSNTLTAKLYENGVYLVSKVIDLQSGSYVFEDVAVYFDRVYTINLYVDYDLRDGEGRQRDHFLSSYAKTSAEPIQPLITIDNVTIESTRITIDYTIKDRLESLLEEGLILTINGTEIIMDIHAHTMVIDNLLSNQAFDLEITANYVYNQETQTFLVYRRSGQTLAKQRPSIHLSGIDTLKEMIRFTVNVDDIDGVVEENSMQLGFYDRDGERIGQLLSVDAIMRVTIRNLWSDSPYTVRIYGDIDFNDDQGVHEAVELFETELRTAALNLPIPSFNDIEVDEFSQRISVTLNAMQDSDEVYSEIKVSLYEVTDEGLSLIESQIIDANDPQPFITFNEFIDLEKEYRVRVYGSYDLRDSFGLQEDVLFDAITYIIPLEQEDELED